MEKKQHSKKPVKPKAEPKEIKLVIPDLIPVNDRIYTKEFKHDHLTRHGILVPNSNQVMGGVVFMVAAADPNIKYTDQDGKEQKLMPGDFVRPFSVKDAAGYAHVTDTFMGEVYTLFHWTEIASVVPRNMADLQFDEK